MGGLQLLVLRTYSRLSAQGSSVMVLRAPCVVLGITPGSTACKPSELICCTVSLAQESAGAGISQGWDFMTEILQSRGLLVLGRQLKGLVQMSLSGSNPRALCWRKPLSTVRCGPKTQTQTNQPNNQIERLLSRLFCG